MTTALTLAAAEAASTASFTVTGARDLLAIIALAIGLFFMFVGVLGVLRLPDAYSRMHAASKCTTLGLTGMLIAAGLHLWTLDVVAKSATVIIFTYIATPIGAHLLAKAAHHGKLPLWDRTLSDELAEDKANPDMAVTDDEIGIPGTEPRPLSKSESRARRLRMSA